jgi:hypothetical protein
MDKLETGDAVASFLFDLMRDHVTSGVVEEIVVRMEKLGPQIAVFEPPGHHLGWYALDLARRIRALDASGEAPSLQKP